MITSTYDPKLWKLAPVEAANGQCSSGLTALDRHAAVDRAMLAAAPESNRELSPERLARALAVSNGYNPDGLAGAVGRKVWQDLIPHADRILAALHAAPDPNHAEGGC
jgi:hypothetical protein